MTAAPGASPQGPEQALLAALGRLLAPLARLAVARGVPHAALDEMLKQALVQAADTAYAELPPHRRISRISTSTGIHRREATRLLQVLREVSGRPQAPRRSRASELLAHWLTSKDFRDRRGRPRVLARQGPGASFEALAQGVTTDVHPRGMLDELLRLGMVEHDRVADTVRLAGDAAAPRTDAARLLQFLGDNVGDHLDGAVDNVIADARPHFEQAVFADGLSAQSIDEIRHQIASQWQATLQSLVPALEAMVARDSGAAGSTQRVRIGLYSFEQDLRAGATDAASSAKDPEK